MNKPQNRELTLSEPSPSNTQDPTKHAPLVHTTLSSSRAYEPAEATPGARETPSDCEPAATRGAPLLPLRRPNLAGQTTVGELVRCWRRPHHRVQHPRLPVSMVVLLGFLLPVFVRVRRRRRPGGADTSHALADATALPWVRDRLHSLSPIRRNSGSCGQNKQYNVAGRLHVCLFPPPLPGQSRHLHTVGFYFTRLHKAQTKALCAKYCACLFRRLHCVQVRPDRW